MGRADWIAVLVAGLVAGTLDIGAAALINFASPVLILQFIAGGLLGRAALSGGAWAALLGLVLQWAMSLVIAAVYVAASTRTAVLRRHWVVGGLAYGVVVFFVMNYAVVPLSAWARWPSFTPAKFAANLLAMLLFGLVVAFCARQAPSRAMAAGRLTGVADRGVP
ncbi:MAG TPA: hypothetical protein VMN79_15125 [Casimicrobiaceae bacterium]|nr:hypothetical protein [Casimicrobiaceae bacterium]